MTPRRIRLARRPHRIVAVTVPGPLTMEDVYRMRERWIEACGRHVPLAIFPNGATITEVTA